MLPLTPQSQQWSEGWLAGQSTSAVFSVTNPGQFVPQPMIAMMEPVDSVIRRDTGPGAVCSTNTGCRTCPESLSVDRQLLESSSAAFQAAVQPHPRTIRVNRSGLMPTQQGNRLGCQSDTGPARRSPKTAVVSSGDSLNRILRIRSINISDKVGTQSNQRALDESMMVEERHGRQWWTSTEMRTWNVKTGIPPRFRRTLTQVVAVATDV